MQNWLRLASLERRAIEQVAKAARMIAALESRSSAQELDRVVKSITEEHSDAGNDVDD